MNEAPPASEAEKFCLKRERKRKSLFNQEVTRYRRWLDHWLQINMDEALSVWSWMSDVGGWPRLKKNEEEAGLYGWFNAPTVYPQTLLRNFQKGHTENAVNWTARQQTLKIIIILEILSVKFVLHWSHGVPKNT